MMIAGGLMALALGFSAPLQAGPLQTSPPDSLQAWFVQGTAAHDAGNYTQAATLFRQVYQAHPSYRTAGGSAVYWLGRSLEAMGEATRAHRIWEAGIGQALAGQRMDVRAADAYVRSVFQHEHREAYPTAARAYLMLLEYADADLEADRAAIIRPHLAQLQFLLPPELRSQALVRTSNGFDVDRSEGGGRALAAWWRSQDPMPATVENERVIEHLERVAHAREQYASDAHPTGFDDRGKVYVRLGTPYRHRQIDFYTREMVEKIRELRQAIGNNLVVSGSDFHDNEFWLYRDEEPYYYLFIDRGNGFEIGEIADLIPRHLRGSADRHTGRGGAKADIVLEALRAAYRQLSTEHLDFSDRYVKIDEFLGKMEELRIRHEVEESQGFYSLDKRSDNTALLRDEGAAGYQGQEPTSFSRNALREARQLDQIIAYRRNELAPRQETHTLDDVEPLRVAARSARFLDDDGTTRTEVYWGAAFDDASRAGRALIDVTVHHMRSDYRSRERHHEQHQLPRGASTQDVFLPDEPLVMRGDTGDYHLSMQWNLHGVEEQDSGSLRAGPRIKSGMARSDSLTALDSSEEVLEMSDLVPVLMPDEGRQQAEGEDRFIGTPYPLSGLTADMPLALYFEVYHLTFDGDDRARFDVEYDVYRRTERGGLARVFRGDREQRTATETTYERPSRTAREYIMLDLDQLEGRGLLQVTVRVRDRTTGQQVERAIEFSFDGQGRE